MQFKVGDMVTIETTCCSAEAGIVYKVFLQGGSLSIGSRKEYVCTCVNEWQLVEDNNNNKSIMESLKEKVALVFKGEPEKSFIKAGVMNPDETLTSDGQSVFLAWLLKENSTKFKTDVVDVILAEDKDSK